MINIRNINIKYDRKILENSEMCLYGGKVHLIKGLSGSGKSSLLYKIGLISEDKNYDFLIDGENINSSNAKKQTMIKRHNIGYVLQDYSLFEQYNVINNLKLYASIIGKVYSEKEYKEILDMVNLNVDFERSIETLSGGERQRLAIACALCKQPDILILDEPTSALDKDNEIIILEVLNNLAHDRGKCIIIASHSYIAGDYADCIYEIKNQKLECVKRESYNDLTLKNIHSILKFGFFNNYIQYFKRKYRSLDMMLLLVICLTLFLSSITIGITNKKLSEIRNDFKSMSPNQLFLTNDSFELYLNDMTGSIDDKTLTTIKELGNVKDVHKTVIIKAFVGGGEVLVLPYYQNNNFDNDLELIIDNNRSDGVYITYDAYTSVASSNFDLNDVPIYYEICNGKTVIGNIESKMSINGVLKKGYVSSYQPNNKNIIFVSRVEYDALLNLYEDKINVFGYTVLLNDFESISFVEHELQKIGLGVNSEFNNAKALGSIVMSTSKLKDNLLIFIVASFSILLVAIQSNYFYKRRIEFALLKINGLGNIDLIILTVIETMERLVKAILLVIFVTSIFNYIQYITKNQILLFNISQISITLLFINCIIFTVLNIINGMYIFKLNPEKVLRR